MNFSLGRQPDFHIAMAVAGNGRDASAGNTVSYITGRLILVSSDRSFASGFDNRLIYFSVPSPVVLPATGRCIFTEQSRDVLKS